jgi:hypothetical protein
MICFCLMSLFISHMQPLLNLCVKTVCCILLLYI